MPAIALRPARATRRRPAPRFTPARLAAAVEPLSVLGPYAHRNLAVFFLVPPSPPAAPRDYLTLHDGLRAGKVRLAEGREARVDRVVVENRSPRPVFVHEGERVRGGYQDRCARVSAVVEPGAVAGLGTCCIEPARWTGRRRFASPKDGALSPRSVRVAAKVDGDQGAVWEAVAREKRAAARALGVASTTTSLNELLDAPQVRQVAGYYLDAIGPALAAARGAVGVAIARDGRLEEADVYATPGLLAALFPRLVAAYAVQAVLSLHGPPAAPPAPAAVRRFLSFRGGSERSARPIDGGAELTVVAAPRPRKKVACVTTHGADVVHLQVLARRR